MAMIFRHAPRGLRRLSVFVVIGVTFIAMLRYRDVTLLKPLMERTIMYENDTHRAAYEVLLPAVETTIFGDAPATHKYLSNGLLEVNPDAPHPFFKLIRDAEAKWQRKLDQASRTLTEAVAEYKRRYKRPPPKGFDDWWRYVQENNVKLPDEYNFLYENLEPFWGVSPEDLNDIQREQEEETDTFTLSKNETHGTGLARVAFSTPDRWRERALLRGMDEIIGLLKPVEHLLPHFRAIFSPHDNPNLLSDYHVKKAFIDAARERRYVDINNLPRVEHYGFASACPPGTPGRMTEAPFDQFHRPDKTPGKRFIHDHLASMNPCTNPSIFYNHAQYVAHDVGPRPRATLAMQFAYCSTPLFHDLQPPTFLSWVDDITPRENDPPWSEKTDERILWRGSNTGINHNDHTRWIYAQRIRLVRAAGETNGTERVLFPPSAVSGVQGEDERDDEEHAGAEELMRVGEGVEVRKALLNPATMDIAFTGEPHGCDPKYCARLETLFEFRRKIPGNSREVGDHKYFVDVDGNGWSSRFKRLITSNSLVFKATAYPEWWIDRVQPWVHYVPVQVDYSDLYDAHAFFRGGLYGEGNHDAMAEKIATAGRVWSQEFWRKEDMTAYFFRLMLEYARLMSLDRDAMSYQG